ncbi:MAG: PDC sensor domain-containing protein [Myxococcota bacterium]
MYVPRLVSGLLLAGALIFAVYLIVDYASYQRERDERTVELGREAGIRVAKALDAQLGAIVEHARGFADEVADTDDEKALLEQIRSASLELPLVLGVTVAFEPGRFPGRDRFAPFFNKSRDEFQFVEDTYDYTDRQLETARWYTDIVESGEAGWSDPYYAEAAEAMVVDFGVPLFDSRGEPRGIVDYAITLSDFTGIVDSLSVGESGYGFTYDENGAILSHPDPQYLLENVFQLRDGKDEAILETMRNDPEGVVAYNSTYTYKYSWFFFRELESTGWKSVLVFAEDDLLGASDQGRRMKIHIAIGLGTLMIAGLVFLATLAPLETRRLWSMVVAVSLVIVGNIVVVWYLNLSTDFSLIERDEERIVNGTILAKYLDRFDRDLHKLVQARYHKVPTGVFIESYELASFEASLIGRLWMKYPKALYEEAPPAFYFSDVSAIESRGIVSELVSEVERDDHFLVTWKFRAKVEQDFSYQQFPFEQNDIELRVLYPDLGRHVLLVPDLGSYEILNPSARPGLNADITVPSSETISTFFSFETIDYDTTFGNGIPVDSHPALVFTMTAKRIWLSPFIANMIPILIVALIMFIVLCVSSNEDHGRSGLTTMNVIQSSAGFLFILLLAHVNERNRIESPEIAYIELFYFSMYVLITLQSVALAISLSGSGWRVLTYRDNLVLKLAYWPVLLTAWYAVTLLRFY